MARAGLTSSLVAGTAALALVLSGCGKRGHECDLQDFFKCVNATGCMWSDTSCMRKDDAHCETIEDELDCTLTWSAGKLCMWAGSRCIAQSAFNSSVCTEMTSGDSCNNVYSHEQLSDKYYCMWTGQTCKVREHNNCVAISNKEACAASDDVCLWSGDGCMAKVEDSCKHVKERKICDRLYQRFGGPCMWGDESCVPASASSCPGLSAVSCTLACYTCQWSGNATGCVALDEKNCGLMTTEKHCNEPAFEGVCMWTGGICIGRSQCDRIPDRESCGKVHTTWDGKSNLCMWSGDDGCVSNNASNCQLIDNEDDCLCGHDEKQSCFTPCKWSGNRCWSWLSTSNASHVLV